MTLSSDSKIPSDSTIASILHKLKKPFGYVSGAYGNMRQWNDEQHPAVIRIGCTGGGHWPFYRIERDGEPVAAYGGRSHGPWPHGDNYQKVRWSTKTMTFDELKALLPKSRTEAERR